MNKTLAATLVGLLALTGAANASTIKQIGDSSYKLYDGADSICSSVAVSPTQLVTAKHCMGSTALNITLEKLDKEFNVIASKTLYLKEVRTLSKFDQVMLELKDPDETLPVWVDIAKPEEVKLELGSPVIAVGYPKVMELTLTHGEFGSKVSLKKFDDSMTEPFYKVTVPITGGNSGGGLYTLITPDKVTAEEGAPEPKPTYKLIGLATAGFRDVSFMNYDGKRINPSDLR
jgi:S1-C subfamily serine protease